MKPEFNYNSFPTDFVHCLNQQCPRANDCLRHQVTLLMPKERGTVTVVNPALMDITNEDCPYYKADKPRLYASGMTHLMDAVPYSEAVFIKQRMIQHFGQNNYYRLKRKERLFTPEHQEFIRDLFQKRGITEPPAFDEYIEMYE